MSLEITAGEVKAIILELTHPNGQAHNFTGFTKVTVAIAREPGQAGALTRDSTVDNAAKLVVAANPAVVTIYPTQAESEALTAGVWIVGVWVEHAGSRIYFERKLTARAGVGE